MRILAKDDLLIFSPSQQATKKIILSDLQGDWQYLRATVVENDGFTGRERMLLHTDEAMSWKTVRHLERMTPLVLLIKVLSLSGL